MRILKNLYSLLFQGSHPMRDMTRPKFTGCLILLMLFLSQLAEAQVGYVTGQVVAASGNSTLPGATVRLKNSFSVGASSDINGKFQIVNVPLGEQVFVVSYIGFSEQEIAVNVVQGENDLGNISMVEDSETLEEVVISVQALGQQVAIQEQLSSDAMVNVISADKIQELPDVNAAEAIGRLPGIALERSGGEGQKVIIRGLQPKFAAISLNGVRLPSTSSTDRSVDLSLIAPELLSGIEVYKAPLPNMDAESTAGTVNLKLSKAPQGQTVLVKGLGGYNDLKGTFQDYKGLLQVSDRLFDNRLGIIAQASTEQFNRSAEILDYDWRIEPSRDNAILGTSLRLRDNQEQRKRTNASLNMDYDLTGGHSLSLFGLYTITNRDRNFREYRVNRDSREISPRSRDIENSLEMFNYSLSGNHPVGKFIIDWTASRAETKGETPYQFEMIFEQNNQELYTDADNQGPNEDASPEDYFGFANTMPQDIFLRANSFENSSTSEITDTYMASVKLPISLSDKVAVELEAGGKYIGIDRRRDWSGLAENFYYLGGEVVQTAIASSGEGVVLTNDGERIAQANFVDNQSDFVSTIVLEDGSEVTIPQSATPSLMRSWFNDQKGNLLNDLRDIPEEKYDLTEIVTAGYFMAKFRVGDRLTLIPGFRYEHSDNVYNAIYAPDESSGRFGELQELRDTTASQNYSEFFPHFHAKYQANDWLDFRFSYAKTIARPDYTRLIPRTEINLSAGTIRAGNTGLLPMLSTSYDFSFSVFKSGWGLFTGGVFYKDIDNLFLNQDLQLATVEDANRFGIDPSLTGSRLSTSVNFRDNEVYGFELDLQSNLANLPAPWSNMVFNVNYARLYSRTVQFFTRSESRFEGVPPIQVTTVTVEQVETTMPDQVPWVMRASVGYDVKGFSIRVSTAYQGDRVAALSITEGFNRFDLGWWRMDAVVKQNIGDNWSVFLNLNNLTNQRDIETRAESTRRYEEQISTFGITGQLGIQFRMKKS